METHAKACDGLLEINDLGEGVYKVCFVAGTLVHTDKGAMPIEKVRVGTRVLSQPEDGGEQDYRSVVNTVAHLDQRVMVVQVRVDGASELTTIITTPNHPFWVEEKLADNQHWMAAESLEPGLTVQLADAKKAHIHATGLVRRTQHADIAFAADHRSGKGIVLNIEGKTVVPADEWTLSDSKHLELGEPCLTPVYNFEVEEFHTYYVGEVRVWVHNSSECTQTQALQAVSRSVDLRDACFHGETLVHIQPGTSTDGSMLNFIRSHTPHLCEIRGLVPGVRVLSRCEHTGEVAYRRVQKVFEHDGQELFVVVYTTVFNGELRECVLDATLNHPIWINDQGWTKVSDIKTGDKFFTVDGIPAEFARLQKRGSGRTVYNIEVEDFHTYFVESEGIWVHNKNTVITVQSLNPNRFPDATPTQAGPSGNPIIALPNELPAQVALARAGIDSVTLPIDARNTLGVDGRRKPDLLLKTGEAANRVGVTH